MDEQKRAADDTCDISDPYGGRIRFEPIEPKHAAIYPYLRQEDRDEIEACSPIDPMLQVAYCIAESEPGHAAYLDNELTAIFGVCGNGAGIGSPWFLATDRLKEAPIAFYRMSKPYIERLKRSYDTLINWVHVKNKLSIRWLEWNGFQFDEPQGDFMRFWWNKEVE